MHTKEVAVLELGSSQVRMIIARRGVNGTFNFVSESKVDYSGYSDGEFVDIYETKEAIFLAKKRCEEACDLQIKNLYVGIPAQFSVLSLKKVYQSNAKKIKITQEVIDGILSRGYEQDYLSTHTLISSSASYYCLDDNRRMANPIKQKTSKISAVVSCVYAETPLIEFLNSVLAECGIEYVEYLSEPECEATYLIGNADKDNFALIVDCGYSSTSVALVRGNALLALQSFSYGGAHIEADLADYLKIPFKSAGELKSKVALSISPEKDEFYELKIGDKIAKINMELANSIVCARIDFIAAAINACIKMCNEEYPEFIRVGLCGGGISYLKGGKDYLAKSLGRNVDLLVPNDPAKNKPSFASTLGLIEKSLKKSQKTSRR